MIHSLSYANEMLGVYETKPELSLNVKLEDSEKNQKIIDYLSWSMEINQDEIVIRNKKQDPLKMKYRIEGNYILAYEDYDETRKYSAFYIENSETIHAFFQIFYKKLI